MFVFDFLMFSNYFDIRSHSISILIQQYFHPDFKELGLSNYHLKFTI